jgi:hypothetical protein
MSQLPDPTSTLTGDDRARYDEMASARAHAEGRAALGQVYVRMFNNPGVAAAVGQLGEHLRFHGTLPDAVRELIILRYASRQGFWYEWSHHQHPAHLAGIDAGVIEAITKGEVPSSLPEGSRAVLQAVDAVVAHQSIPADVQERVVVAHGNAGVVELVALCGLYAIMGYMVTAFDIPIEPGLPSPPSGV